MLLLQTVVSLIVERTTPVIPIASSVGQVLTRHLKISQSKMLAPPIRHPLTSLPNPSLLWPPTFREVVWFLPQL